MPEGIIVQKIDMINTEPERTKMSAYGLLRFYGVNGCHVCIWLES